MADEEFPHPTAQRDAVEAMAGLISRLRGAADLTDAQAAAKAPAADAADASVLRSAAAQLELVVDGLREHLGDELFEGS